MTIVWAGLALGSIYALTALLYNVTVATAGVLIDQGRVLLREEAADVSFDLVATTMFGSGAV
jgi:hypothetical protein